MHDSRGNGDKQNSRFSSLIKRTAALFLCMCLCAGNIAPPAMADTNEISYSDFYYSPYCDMLLALRSDGTVAATGLEDFEKEYSMEAGCLDVIGTWTDIVELKVIDSAIYGVTAEGRVLCAGSSDHDLSGWEDVVSIDGWRVMVGLRSDGTMLYSGSFNSPGLDASEISTWENVEQFCFGHGGYDDNSIIAMSSDGTVMGIGERWEYLGWPGTVKDAKWIYSDGWISGCVLDDGTVMIWGTDSGHPDSEYSKLYPDFFADDPEDDSESFAEQVATWKNIKQMFLDELYILALTEDGRIVHTDMFFEEYQPLLDQFDSWKGIEKIYYNYVRNLFAGLTKDGRALFPEIPIDDYYSSFTEEEYASIRDTVRSWKNLVDIEVYSYAVVGIDKYGQRHIAAPFHEEFLEKDRADHGHINNTLRSPREDFVDFACDTPPSADAPALIAWRENGTVYTQGLEFLGEENAKEIAGWKDIASAGFWTDTHGATSAVYGIKKDGSVVFCGTWDFDDEPYASSKKWKNVAQISNYGDALVLLKDGRVHDTDGNFLKGWKDIVYISATASPMHRTFLGLTADGKLLSMSDKAGFEYGYDIEGEHSSLKGNTDDIVSVDTNSFFIAAVKKDGSVITDHRRLNEKTSDWDNIVQLCVAGMGTDSILGLTDKGRVLVAHDKDDDYYAPLSKWRNIKTLYYADFDIAASSTVIGIGNDGKLSILCHNDELAPMLEWENVKKLCGSEEFGFFAALTEDGKLLIHSIKKESE